MTEATRVSSIEQVLEGFLREVSIARHPATGRRVAASRVRLACYLASDADAALAPEERALVAAERQFGATGAAERALGPAALLRALPGYLRRPWLPSEPIAARTQVRMAEMLVDYVVGAELVEADEAATSAHAVSRAAAQARRELAAATAPGG